MRLRVLIVALVVALIAAGGSTAAFVVTSKNIKNGTIQLIDISSRAKAGLRGQRGPRGFTGAQGAQGAQGPAGPGLVSTRYTSASSAINALSVMSVSVQCASDEIVISGGGSTGAGFLFQSVAISPQGWQIAVRNDTNSAGTMTVQALCGRIAAGAASATPIQRARLASQTP
jgi:hypothetical protein